MEQHFLLQWSIGLIFLILFVGLLRTKIHKYLLIITTIFPFVCGCFLGLSIQTHENNLKNFIEEIQKEKQILVEGTVLKVHCRGDNTQVKIQIKTIMFKDKKQSVDGSDLIMFFDTKPSLVTDWIYGDFIRVLGVPETTDIKNRDYHDYLLKASSVVLICHHIVNVHKIYSSRCFFRGRCLAYLRNKFSTQLESYDSFLGHDSVEILKAWILGFRSGVSVYLKNLFKKSGTYHIFAISGLHVMLFYSMCCFILIRFISGWKVFFVFFIPLLFVWVSLIGYSASVVRASLMLVCIKICHVVGRPIKRENVFFFILFLMLLYDPQQINNLSFQMSFLSIAIILLSLRKNHSFFQMMGPVSLFSKAFFFDLLRIPLALSLGMFPITMCCFHRIILLGLLSNILVIPLMVIAIHQGVILLVLSFFKWIRWVDCFLQYILLPLEKYIMETILAIVGFFSQWGCFSVHCDIHLIHFYFSIVLLAVLFSLILKKKSQF